ncbi:MAG: hypothetical protein HKL88_05175 [Bacteroidia bacterium]|nr:hypothetical protein [Bacteroidia bacterium]
MKINRYLLIAGLGMALAGAIFVGCKKSDNTTTNNPNDITAAQDDNNANFAVQDTKNVADGAAKSQAVERLANAPCAHISFHKDTINHTSDSLIDINFGSSPCLCLDNRYRSGHILVWYAGVHCFTVNGDSTVMGFNGYSFGNSPSSMIGVSGTRTLINLGTDTGNGLYSWKFHAALTLTYPGNGGTATWNSTRTIALTSYMGTNYFMVTGGANGTCRSGATYTITINNSYPLYIQPPLCVHFNYMSTPCAFIEAGELTITVSTFSYPIYVSFGSGNAMPPVCESKATATINGVAYNFTQP